MDGKERPTLRVRNWDKWQSYRTDRGQPPWIKVHREVMRNPDWVALTDAQRGQLVAIWLLAADHNGVIPASPTIIMRLCYLDTLPDLELFMEHGFIEHGVIVASDGRQDDAKTTQQIQIQRQSRDRENTIGRFDEFWLHYPKKVKKSDALKKWATKKLDRLADQIIADVITRTEKDRRWIDGFAPDPTTYLNGERWNDAIETARPNGNGGTPRTDDQWVEKGRSMGISAKAGESMGAYIGRIRAAMGVAHG